MKRQLTGIFIISLLVASSVSFMVGGAAIEFTNLEDGDVLTTRTYEVTGTAQALPDYWTTDTAEEFEAGTFDNMTVNQDGRLIVDPFISTFKKDPNNPVEDYGGAYSYNEYGTFMGTVMKDGNTFKMWSIGIDRYYNYGLGYSTSTNGTDWSSQNVTFDLGGPGSFDEYQIVPGSVIKDGATYKMWYSGMDYDGIYRIGYATSSDGITWTKGNNGDPVIDIGTINKFDGGGVMTPSVIKEDGVYKMWFSGMIAYSGGLYQVGYATSQDGVSWTRQNDNEPVVSFGGSTSFDKDGIFYPTVIRDGPVLRMFYIGQPQGDVGHASSPDGINWEKENDEQPVMSKGASGTFDENGIGSIAAIKEGTEVRLFYVGYNAFHEPAVGMAKATLEGLTGVYISELYSGDLVVDWGAVTHDADLPEGTTLKIQTRVSNDRIDWSSWADLINDSSAYESGKFCYYKVIMTSPDGLAMPTLGTISLAYSAIMKMEISIDNSTWLEATGTKEWNLSMNLSEGPNTVYVRMTDTTDIPTYGTVDIIVDTLQPTGILNIDNDVGFTKDTTVELSLIAVDARGVAEMRFSSDEEDLENATWEPFAASAEFVIPEEEGIVTVFCQLKDNTGLISNVISDSIMLDMTPPNGTVKVKSGAPMTSQATVPLSMSATDSNGISKMRVSNDPDMTGAEWTTYAAAWDWTLSEGDGEKTVYVEFMDKAGLTTVANDTILLDTVKPTGSIKVNDDDIITTVRQVTVTLTAQDSNGVSHVMLSNDDAFAEGVWTSLNGTLPWTLPETSGEVTVYARFKDSAGLVSDVAKDSIVLDIHEEGFEGIIVINDGDLYTNDQTLRVSLTLIGDDGASSVMLSESTDFSGASWQPMNASATYTTTTTFGTLTLYAKFKDKYGVETAVVNDTIEMDTMAPVLVIMTPEEGSRVKDPFVSIWGLAADDMDLYKVEVELPNGEWIPVDNPSNFTFVLNLVDKGQQTINMRATDEAGNVGTASVTIKYKPEEDQDTMPGFEAAALVIGMLLVALLLSRRRVLRV